MTGEGSVGGGGRGAGLGFYVDMISSVEGGTCKLLTAYLSNGWVQAVVASLEEVSLEVSLEVREE